MHNITISKSNTVGVSASALRVVSRVLPPKPHSVRPSPAGAALGPLPDLGLTRVGLGAGPHLVRYIYTETSLTYHEEDFIRPFPNAFLSGFPTNEFASLAIISIINLTPLRG